MVGCKELVKVQVVLAHNIQNGFVHNNIFVQVPLFLSLY